MSNFNPIMGENRLPEFISVISASKCARIRIEDIEVIEQEGRKLHIITADREYCFYENMKELILCLYGRAFYRPVKGLIINFEHIKEIAGSDVILHSGHVVTMGKNSLTRTRSAYKKYLLRYPPYSMVGVKPESFAVGESAAPDPLKESDNAPDQTSDLEYASALIDAEVHIPVRKGTDIYKSKGYAGQRQ